MCNLSLLQIRFNLLPIKSIILQIVFAIQVHHLNLILIPYLILISHIHLSSVVFLNIHLLSVKMISQYLLQIQWSHLSYYYLMLSAYHFAQLHLSSSSNRFCSSICAFHSSNHTNNHNFMTDVAVIIVKSLTLL